MKPKQKKIHNEGVLKDALQRVGIGTPRSAVDALVEEILGPNAALLGRRGPKRPSRKSEDPKERKEADKKRDKHSRSLAQIAGALHCEGFNEFAAFGVLHYARTRLWGEKWGEKTEQLREELQESMREATPEQRKAAGQFIHFQAAASFQAGLRIGLMASLWTLALCEQGRAGRACYNETKEDA